MSTKAPLRNFEEVELPIAGTWKVDPGHAEVGFWGRHFMLTKVRARFTGSTPPSSSLRTRPNPQWRPPSRWHR